MESGTAGSGGRRAAVRVALVVPIALITAGVLELRAATFERRLPIGNGDTVTVTVSGVRVVYADGDAEFVVPEAPVQAIRVTVGLRPTNGPYCHGDYAWQAVGAWVSHDDLDIRKAVGPGRSGQELSSPLCHPESPPGPVTDTFETAPVSWNRGLLYAGAMVRVGTTELWAEWRAYIVGVVPTSLGRPDDHPLAAYDETPLSCSTVGMPNYSVHLGTRGLAVWDTELAYGSLGPQVRATRTYNALPLEAQRVGAFGAGWRLDYESSLSAFADGVQVRRGSGAVDDVSSPGFAPGGALPGVDVAIRLPGSPRRRLVWHAAGRNFVLEDQERHEFLRYVPVSDRADYFRLAAVADANGNAVLVSYEGTTAASRIVAVTDAGGRATTFEYPGPGQPVSAMTAPDGRRATFTYAELCSSGLCVPGLASSTDFLGTVTHFTYDASGRITRIETAGKTVTIAWAGDKVASVTDASGGLTTYTTAADGATHVARPSSSERYLHDGNLLASSTDAWGRTMTREYQADGLPSRIDDAGAVTTFAYDGARNLVARTDPAGRTTRWTWDTDGYPVSETTPDGAVWTFAYDEHHNLTSVTSPLNRQRKVVYDARGLPTAVVDTLGRRQVLAYNDAGQLVASTDRTGRVTTITYDGAGKLASVRPLGVAPGTRYGYDANDRLTSVTEPDGSVRLTTYDACTPVETTDETGARTTMTWDAALRPTAVTDALGHRWTASYDGDGLPVAYVDPLGRTTTVFHNKTGRIVQTTDATRTLSWVAMNARGALLEVVAPQRDGVRPLTRLTRNAADELVALEDPLGQVVAYTRDALGRVTRTTNARGGRVDDAFDADGQWTSRAHDDEQAAAFTYDDDGAVVSAAARGVGTTQFARDAEGRVLTITYPDGSATRATYDARGNRSTLTYPSGLAVTYSYDLRDRVSRVSWAGASVDVQRDAAGRIVGLTRANAVTSTFTLDALGRLARVVHGSATRTLVDLTVLRDGAGNVVRVHGVEPHPRGFTAGAVQVTYDVADQIVSRNGASYHYDADGNLERVDGARSWLAAYDAENRLVSLTRSGQPTLAASYDAFGWRARRVVGSAVEVFRRDEDSRVLSEANDAGQVIAEYVYVDGRLLATVRGGQTYFFLFDHLGSTLALTDAAGAVATAYGYDVTGRVIARSGSLANRFTFVGEHGVEDDGVGLYLMGRRHYDAATGRFVQRDPIGFAGGMNLYAYAEGRPTTLIDPEGTNPALLYYGGSAVISVAVAAYSWWSSASTTVAGVQRTQQEWSTLANVRQQHQQAACELIAAVGDDMQFQDAYFKEREARKGYFQQVGRVGEAVRDTGLSAAKTVLKTDKVARTWRNLWGLIVR